MIDDLYVNPFYYNSLSLIITREDERHSKI